MIGGGVCIGAMLQMKNVDNNASQPFKAKNWLCARPVHR